MRLVSSGVLPSDSDQLVALAGNPNVGKSTVFNGLTGLNQHTGNWPGKTVASARGSYLYHNIGYTLVDLPGTYSLSAHSAEEEVTRDFVCFGGADSIAVVCDATCLERNLNLVLQVLEVNPRTVVCLNLMDEAAKKEIRIDEVLLGRLLGVPVVLANARDGVGLDALMNAIEAVSSGISPSPVPVRYPAAVEEAATLVQAALPAAVTSRWPARWVALRLLEGTPALLDALESACASSLRTDDTVSSALSQAAGILEAAGLNPQGIQDCLAACPVLRAEEICMEAVHFERADYAARDRKLDRLLTSRATGIPAMLLLLAGVLWLTIAGANYPSALLADFLLNIELQLAGCFSLWGAPAWLTGVVVHGMYHVLAMVVSVMLPPMAIFFPLFTLLEDVGYLPRVAFNLDRCFQRAHTCGKQSLTLCMGFGCNAAGVVGCRIIDSPRERLIAILTNNFVPCNGRFPTLIALITMFFVGSGGGGSATSALLLTGVILLGVACTLGASWLLSCTALRGLPSSFALELPPYRRPQIGRVIVRSVFDRTLFVLGRAMVVAAPAGALLWILANNTVDGVSLLSHCAAFLDPLGRALGMDGVILIAFVLGFPANEIVLPIIMMTYMATGQITDPSSLGELHTLLTANGWTGVTALCTMLFCLLHWPCSTTCLTIHTETGSLKWTALAILLPTVTGMAACFLVASAARLLGLG